MAGQYVNPDGTPWTPEFDGQRPPFQPGNQLSVGNTGRLTHGINSPRMVDPIAKRIIAELKADPATDWLRSPRFADLLTAYARAAARVELVTAWTDGQSMSALTDSADGRTSPLELLRQLSATAGTLADRLGLSPIVSDEVQANIDAARAALRMSMAKREARAQLQADLRDAIRTQVFGDQQ